MKRHAFFWARVVVFFSVVPLFHSQTRLAQAGYVEEVEADQPFMWWRLDEPEGEDFAENSGEADIEGWRIH